MLSIPLISAFIGSAILCWLLCFPVRRELARRDLLDRPNARSSHQMPTPRGGGIAIVCAIAAGGLLFVLSSGNALPVVSIGLAIVLALVSFLDDLKPLSAGIRFSVHSVAAISFLAFLSYRLPHVSPGLMAVTAGASFLWIVGYTNAFNFMDGINGIASAQGVLTGIGTCLVLGMSQDGWTHPVQILAALVAGACLGFLPHNFPHARLFMGDVGSAPLGFLLAGMVVAGGAEHGWTILLPLGLLHANYILDTSITLLRRFLRGERIYEAHREHFYQRLVRSGKTHTSVTGWEIGLQILTLAVVLAMLQMSMGVQIVGGMVVCMIWLGFFSYAERRFRLTSRGASNLPGPARVIQTF